MGATSLPQIYAQLLAARGLIAPDPFTVLIIGQIGTGGTATSGQAYDDVQDLTEDEIDDLFGSDSELTGRIIRARKECKARFPIWVIALDPDGAAVDADVDITVVGTATADGSITIKAIDEYLYTATIDILSGDTADDIAGNIKAALDGFLRFPATTGTVTAGVFTVTANDGGTIPNKFVIKVEGTLPAGVTSITAGQFSGGANDPDTTTIFDNVQAQRFHSISWPWEDDYDDVKSFLEGRNIINNAFLHGVAYIGYDDTEANITAKLNGGTPENSPNLVFMGNRVISGEAVIPTPPDWRCIEFMTIEALRQTPNVPIGNFITVSSALDITGNPGLASLAYYNTPLAMTGIVDPDLLFDNQEQNNLRDDGFTIVGVNESKTSMIMGEVVSTYKKNLLGENDVSFKYLNYIRTGYLALEIYYRTLKSDYSQSRLTEGDLIGGRAMTNEKQIAGNLLRIYQTLSGADFVLTQAGSDAESYFNSQLTVSVDLAEGSVTIAGILPIVTQLRVINMTFQIAFTIGG